MTCEEFQAAADAKCVWEMTRGERAVCVKHFNNCEDCRKWLMDTTLPLQLPGIAALRAKDETDPEFVEASR